MDETFVQKKDDEKRQFYVARNLFLRLLGGIYFLAFFSLLLQAQGLWGREGILPVQDYLKAVQEYFGPDCYLKQLTIFWLNSSDSFLIFACYLGMAFSVVLMAGFLPAVCCFFLWGLYLSFIYIGQAFMSFQWDILLVEIGFLSIFFSPWGLRLSSAKSKLPRVILLLLYIVLFKVMVQSGFVKWMSHDKTWRDLTALTYHYWTQPIPNPVSWYVHHLPLWLHKFSCFMMFVIEIFVPFWIFMGRRMRLAAIFPLVGLQGLILATGNYCFFNLLMIVLCVLLIDDKSFAKIWSVQVMARLKPERTGLYPPRWSDLIKTWICFSVAVIVCVLNVNIMVRMMGGSKAVPDILKRIEKEADPFLLSNGYGLFAVMTTKRPEIIIEGSHDGRFWDAYEFKYKPGDLNRRPPQVAPFQPRIDWQMWFAALSGNVQHSPWFLNMLERLAKNEPTVIKLLAHNPFEETPPKYLRAKLYYYEFTSPDEKRETGQWWKRTFWKTYLPAVYLK
ncbi:MAG: lipase maturation factor family protein [Candidatus Omnitrophota bacterium]